MSTQLLPPLLLAASGRGRRVPLLSLLPLLALVAVTEQAGCTRVRIDNEEYEVDTTP